MESAQTANPVLDKLKQSQAASGKAETEAAKRRASGKQRPSNANKAASAMARTASALQAKVNELLAENKPVTKTLAEADALSVKALRDVGTTQLELHSTGVAKLAEAWRDSALHLLESGEIQPDQNAATRLLAHIRQITSAVVVSEEKDEYENDKTNTVVLQRKTLFDAVDRATERVASRAAMLRAISSRSKVVVGYLSGEKLPAPMLMPGTVCQSGKPNRGSYFQVIAAPANVLRPQKVLGVDDKADKAGTYGAVATFPNTDESLRPVLWSQIDALFEHHFANAKLNFDMRSKVKGVQPTGLLVKLPAQRGAGANAATRTTGATTMEEALRKLGNTPEGALVALASKVRDMRPVQWGAANPRAMAGAAFRLATECVCALRREGFFTEKAFGDSETGGELTLLLDTVNSCVTENKDVYRTVVDGKPAVVLDSTKRIMPDKPEEKKTATEAAKS